MILLQTLHQRRADSGQGSRRNKNKRRKTKGLKTFNKTTERRSKALKNIK